MPEPILYKYRALGQWQYVLDIIVNSRLHSAPFTELNDPMEGRYFYAGDDIGKAVRKAVLRSKRNRNICSLSKERDNTLLWSYYAGGHTGVAFGVRLPKATRDYAEVRPVTYDNGVYIDAREARRDPDAVALNILTQKQWAWEIEKEVRVFVPDSYVPVKLVELVLGCNINPDDEELITKIARKWHPRLRIEKLSRSNLDQPEALEQRRMSGRR